MTNKPKESHYLTITDEQHYRTPTPTAMQCDAMRCDIHTPRDTTRRGRLSSRLVSSPCLVLYSLVLSCLYPLSCLVLYPLSCLYPFLCLGGECRVPLSLTILPLPCRMLYVVPWLCCCRSLPLAHTPIYPPTCLPAHCCFYAHAYTHTHTHIRIHTPAGRSFSSVPRT